MTIKRFFAPSFVALLLFAAFIASGCGGSSSNLADTSSPDTTTDAEMPSRVSVFDSPEFDVVGQEVEAEMISEDLTEPNIHIVMIISGDDYFITDDTDNVSSANAQSVKAAATLPENKLQELSAKIKPYYESGDVIALFWPSAATINDLYEAVGEPPMNVDPAQLLSGSEDEYPEMYAIAKRYNGDVAHNFSYVVPGSTAFLEDVLEEIMSLDSNDTSGSQQSTQTEENSGVVYDKYAGLRQGYLFQARRYADFVLWAARIDSEMAEMMNFESSSEFPLRSAALTNESKSGEMFNYGAQKITVDVSYKSGNISYLHFSAAAHYSVYSFYDFGDKNEYYYVQANCFVKPEAYRKYTDSEGTKTKGSMRWYNFSHSINGATYNLFSHAPHNVNRSSTVNDGTSYGTTNTTGYKVGTEVGAEIGTDGAKVSSKVSSEYSSSTSKSTGYNHSATWTTNDWAIIDESNTATPSWKVDFKAPDYNSGGPNGYYPDWNGNVPEASTRRNDLDSEWMWQVTQSNQSISIRTQLNAQLRETWCGNNARDNRYANGTPYGTAPIAKPPHIIVKQKNFDFGKVGGIALFRLICGGNWQAVSDSGWCQVQPSSGAATGGEEQSVYIQAKTFDTGTGDLEVRQANVMVKDLETGQIQTIKIAQNNW